MPDENPILRHWQTELQVFYENLLLLQNQLTAEAIHDLRVAIKKLRSYLKLCSGLFKKKDAEKLFEKTRELFSVIGKHRNIETTKGLLLSFAGKDKPVSKSLFIYLQLLQDQVSQYCQEALQQYEKDQLNELTNRLQKDFGNLDAEDITGITKKLIASSVKNIKRNLKHFKDKSHEVRKDLKDIFYWSKIFDYDVFFTKSQLKTIDKILDHLGNIQDHEVLKTNLKGFRKTILSSSIAEYDLIKKIEIRAEKKKDGFFEKANKMTEELIPAL